MEYELLAHRVLFLFKRWPVKFFLFRQLTLCHWSRVVQCVSTGLTQNFYCVGRSKISNILCLLKNWRFWRHYWKIRVYLDKSPASASSRTMLSSFSSMKDAKYLITLGWSSCWRIKFYQIVKTFATFWTLRFCTLSKFLCMFAIHEHIISFCTLLQLFELILNFEHFLKVMTIFLCFYILTKEPTKQLKTKRHFHKTSLRPFSYCFHSKKVYSLFFQSVLKKTRKLKI